MNAQDLIQAIRDAGARDDDALVKAALEDGAVVGWLFGLVEIEYEDEAITEAQAIVEEAHSLL